VSRRRSASYGGRAGRFQGGDDLGIDELRNFSINDWDKRNTYTTKADVAYEATAVQPSFIIPKFLNS